MRRHSGALGDKPGLASTGCQQDGVVPPEVRPLSMSLHRPGGSIPRCPSATSAGISSPRNAASCCSLQIEATPSQGNWSAQVWSRLTTTLPRSRWLVRWRFVLDWEMRSRRWPLSRSSGRRCAHSRFGTTLPPWKRSAELCCPERRFASCLRQRKPFSGRRCPRRDQFQGASGSRRNAREAISGIVRPIATPPEIGRST